jgi:glycosyltransferase involved in cell wall biosynthesis
VFSSLAELDKRIGFDVIHLQDRWFPDFNSAGIYAKLARKPFVVTLHNARPLGIAPHYTVVGGLYDLAIGRQALAMADKIISVSKWAIDDVCKYGLDERKFACIPNGINTRELKPVKSASFKQSRKLGSGPMALFVGRLIKQKGLEYLLQAWNEVAVRVPRARLAVIGRGNELPALQKLSRKLGIEESVLFTGYVSESELYDALHSCDVFILPSLWEVLPIAILEAMAAGKPIICTAVGGNSELVRNGVNGFIVPKRNPRALAKALERVFADAKLRERMGSASRERAVSEFDWPIIAAQTQSFYKRLLAESAPLRRKHRGLSAAELSELGKELAESLRERRLKAEFALREQGRKWRERMRALRQRMLDALE